MIRSHPHAGPQGAKLKGSLLSAVSRLPVNLISSPQPHPSNQEDVVSGQSGITVEGCRFAEKWEEEQKEQCVHNEDTEQGAEI